MVRFSIDFNNGSLACDICLFSGQIIMGRLPFSLEKKNSQNTFLVEKSWNLIRMM